MYLFTMSQSFGEWIKKLRETHGWTVQLCADRASMKWEAWARLEKDEPRRQNGEAPQRSRSTARAVAAGLLVSENEALKRAGYDSDENTGHLNEIQAIVDSLGEDDAEELLMIARLKLKRHKSRGKPSGANGKEDVPQYTLPPSRVQFDLVEQKLYNAEGQPADEGLQNKFRSAVGRLFLDEDIVTLTQEQKPASEVLGDDPTTTY